MRLLSTTVKIFVYFYAPHASIYICINVPIWCIFFEFSDKYTEYVDVLFRLSLYSKVIWVFTFALNG